MIENQGIFFMEEKEIKDNQKQQEFETDQNLIGIFSILLQVDKRINPQNYKPQNYQND